MVDGDTVFGLSIHLVMDIWAASILWVLWTYVYTYLFESLLSNLGVAGTIPRNGIAGLYNLMFTFWGIAKLFSVLHSQQESMRVPISPYPLWHSCYFSIFLIQPFWQGCPSAPNRKPPAEGSLDGSCSALAKAAGNGCLCSRVWGYHSRATWSKCFQFSSVSAA